MEICEYLNANKGYWMKNYMMQNEYSGVFSNVIVLDELFREEGIYVYEL